MFACSGILFNHESPRRGLEFVTRKITHGVARIKLGLANELRLGNLQAKRDWGFAGDYVAGDVADAAAGPARRLRHRHRRDALASRSSSQIAFDHVGLDWRKSCRRRSAVLSAGGGGPAAGRPDARRERELGWEPEVSFEQLVTHDGGRRPGGAVGEPAATAVDRGVTSLRALGISPDSVQ